MLDSVHDIFYRCCHSLVTTHPPSNTKILMHSCAKILLQICILCNLCRIYFYLLFMPLSFEWGYYFWLQPSKLDWGKQALCKLNSSARNSRSLNGIQQKQRDLIMIIKKTSRSFVLFRNLKNNSIYKLICPDIYLSLPRYIYFKVTCQSVSVG